MNTAGHMNIYTVTNRKIECNGLGHFHFIVNVVQLTSMSKYEWPEKTAHKKMRYRFEGFLGWTIVLFYSSILMFRSALLLEVVHSCWLLGLCLGVLLVVGQSSLNAGVVVVVVGLASAWFRPVLCLSRSFFGHESLIVWEVCKDWVLTKCQCYSSVILVWILMDFHALCPQWYQGFYKLCSSKSICTLLVAINAANNNTENRFVTFTQSTSTLYQLWFTIRAW